MSRTISPQALHERVKQGEAIELIDVRTPVEFREIHAVPARNVPLDVLEPAALKGAAAGRPVFVICKGGTRGRQACDRLIAAGLSDVANVEGGTVAWEQADLPVVRGKKAVSLERQVRIAAGFLVLVGSSLGAFVHSGWFGLSAFVGAGLMFAGITDTCGMAMVLSRMPWNRCST